MSDTLLSLFVCVDYKFLGNSREYIYIFIYINVIDVKLFQKPTILAPKSEIKPVEKQKKNIFSTLLTH